MRVAQGARTQGPPWPQPDGTKAIPVPWQWALNPWLGGGGDLLAEIGTPADVPTYFSHVSMSSRSQGTYIYTFMCKCVYLCRRMCMRIPYVCVCMYVVRICIFICICCVYVPYYTYMYLYLYRIRTVRTCICICQCICIWIFTSKFVVLEGRRIAAPWLAH